MAEVTQPRLHEFVATVSHELRSPLTSLQATLELLEEEARSGAPDSAQTAIYVEIALRQTRRLIRLATDLLDVSRLDGDAPLALHRIQLGELAQVVQREFATRLRAGRRRLRVEGTPAVALADTAAVARILRILLDNATAYGAGTVTVTVAVSTDAEHVLVAVADEGPGIAPDEREQIFGRFVRGSAAAGAPAGAGLGLSLARGLARAMGGELEAAPVPLGARFVLTLPAEDDA